MSNPQVKMLNEVLDLIESTGRTPIEAYENLLDYIAYELGFKGSSTPSMNVHIHDKIQNTLDLDLLRQERWDWLGEVYEHRGISNPRTGQFFTPKSVSDLVAAMNRPTGTDASNPQRMLDPCVGSGRLILSMFELAGNGMMYYGADIDIVAYRTALVNMRLYNIPARILCCNSLVVDLSPASSNWQYANMWIPVAEKRMTKQSDNKA